MNFVKSFYNSLTNSYRPNIEFIKICHLKFNSNYISSYLKKNNLKKTKNNI